MHSGAKGTLDTDRIRSLLRAATRLLDDSIAENRREDGLFHAYNLLAIGDEGFSIDRLPLMLEGQVAVLASGVLNTTDSLTLLNALRASDLYRPDQNSFLLYPAARLPGFLDKNRIDDDAVRADPWIQGELDGGRTDFFERDSDGQVRFNGRFRNGCEFRLALAEERDVDPDTTQRLGKLFEKVFQHRRFTGRSGTMYKYEGLGCIYWHMVSKLLLEVGDLLHAEGGADDAIHEGLLGHYRQIEAGLGLHKSPAEYGAFPTDPYSHTPAFAGVQQPGMTGQVKEDVISRFRELGVRVEDGCVHFAPTYLDRAEFDAAAREWTFSTGGETRTETLPPDSLAFCLCGVPVVYRITKQASIRLHATETKVISLEGSHLDPSWSRCLFDRNGELRKIEVDVPESALR